MRPITFLFAITACISLGSASQAQQLPAFNPGDAVDFYTFGKWIPCTIEAPLAAGAYNVRCGSVDLRAKPDPRELRMHVAPPPGVQMAFGVESAPAPVATEMSIGARYGTRDPRPCDRRPDHFSAAEAKDVFICDAEHEFDGSLYLVSDAALNVATPRPFDPATDANKPGIDRAQPVFDLLATYNNYQCSPVPSHSDNPNIRTCTEFHAANAAGGCFKNTAGDWHCIVFDSNAATTATSKNVGPPTLIE